MSLAARVEEDLKKALKARDSATVACLRLIRAALHNKFKDLGRELNEQEEIAVLKSLAKQRREAAASYEQAGRTEQAEAEKRELEIIESYLPRQLSEEEISSILDEIFAELNPSGPKDMGRVMKQAMARMAGRADGAVVSQMVKARLSKI